MEKKEKLLRDWDIDVIQRTLFSEQVKNIVSEDEIEDPLKFLKDYELYKKELLKESDRGLILTIAAYLEDLLKVVLEKKLIGSNNHKKELFNFNGPLGTFSAKISMSYSIGILGKEEQTEINQIRKIRNEFAHSFKIINLESNKIKQLISSLQFFPKDVPKLNNKEKIIFSFTILSGRLINLTHSNEKFLEFNVKSNNFEGYYEALQIMTQGRR